MKSSTFTLFEIFQILCLIACWSSYWKYKNLLMLPENFMKEKQQAKTWEDNWGTFVLKFTPLTQSTSKRNIFLSHAKYKKSCIAWSNFKTANSWSIYNKDIHRKISITHYFKRMSMVLQSNLKCLKVSWYLQFLKNTKYVWIILNHF